MHYSFSFHLLLHFAISADHGTASHVLDPTLPLLKAAQPLVNSAISKSVSRNLGINTGLFPHNGHSAADTSPFELCGGKDISQFLLLSPEAQKVTADPSLVPGLIWLSKHV